MSVTVGSALNMSGVEPVLFVFLFDCNWPQIVETYNSVINTKRVGTLNFIYQLPSSRVR